LIDNPQIDEPRILSWEVRDGQDLAAHCIDFYKAVDEYICDEDT
jgi:hypothetical protein